MTPVDLMALEIAQNVVVEVRSGVAMNLWGAVDICLRAQDLSPVSRKLTGQSMDRSKGVQRVPEC